MRQIFLVPFTTLSFLDYAAKKLLARHEHEKRADWTLLKEHNEEDLRVIVSLRDQQFKNTLVWLKMHYKKIVQYNLKCE